MSLDEDCDNWILYHLSMLQFSDYTVVRMTLHFSLLFYTSVSASCVYGEQNSSMYLTVDSIYQALFQPPYSTES